MRLKKNGQNLDEKQSFEFSEYLPESQISFSFVEKITIEVERFLKIL
jgi:hypothetical protein